MTHLHLEVQAAAGDIFADQHFEAAENESFKSIEIRVRTITSMAKTAVPMMAEAFRPDGSVLDVATHEGKNGECERDGSSTCSAAPCSASATPGSHELFKPGDSQQAVEYLGFASLLHRRIDVAEQKGPGISTRDPSATAP